MIRVRRSSIGRRCRAAAVAATALGAAALLLPASAVACSGACNWDGVWGTQNKFGTPKLVLTEEGRDVSGRYLDNHGEVKGKISGNLSSDKQTWEGDFHQTVGGSDGGTFEVHLQGDKVSFKGTFTSRATDGEGRRICTSRDPCKWTGEHA
jgi:hypothetical protein